MQKRRVDNAIPAPENDLEFGDGDNKECEVKAIIDNMVYGK